MQRDEDDVIVHDGESISTVKSAKIKQYEKILKELKKHCSIIKKIENCNNSVESMKRDIIGKVPKELHVLLNNNTEILPNKLLLKNTDFSQPTNRSNQHTHPLVIFLKITEYNNIYRSIQSTFEYLKLKDNNHTEDTLERFNRYLEQAQNEKRKCNKQKDRSKFQLYSIFDQCRDYRKEFIKLYIEYGKRLPNIIQLIRDNIQQLSTAPSFAEKLETLKSGETRSNLIFWELPQNKRHRTLTQNRPLPYSEKLLKKHQVMHRRVQDKFFRIGTKLIEKKHPDCLHHSDCLYNAIINLYEHSNGNNPKNAIPIDGISGRAFVIALTRANLKYRNFETIHFKIGEYNYKIERGKSSDDSWNFELKHYKYKNKEEPAKKGKTYVQLLDTINKIISQSKSINAESEIAIELLKRFRKIETFIRNDDLGIGVQKSTATNYNQINSLNFLLLLNLLEITRRLYRKNGRPINDIDHLPVGIILVRQLLCIANPIFRVSFDDIFAKSGNKTSGALPASEAKKPGRFAVHQRSKLSDNIYVAQKAHIELDKHLTTIAAIKLWPKSKNCIFTENPNDVRHLELAYYGGDSESDSDGEDYDELFEREEQESHNGEGPAPRPQH